ncbi:ACT domain-containing protein [Candidatus Poriferisocius sp.]|uniref:ACT domain-containing protein n=1 Tax=Candidatus Poriferisocius sp. TaxID=3101276 RepID=UPI003B0195E8
MNQPAGQDHRIIVIVPHEPGQLAHIAGLLVEENINVEAIDGQLVGDLGVLILSTSDDDAALQILLRDNLRAVTSDALVFQIPDRPGALAGVVQLFEQNGLNVRTIHIIHRHGGTAVVAVTTDNDELASSLLDPDSLL